MKTDKYSGLEKRKFPRLKDSIFILGKLRSSPAGEFKALTNNISAGGLMFENERNISKEEQLELEIYQPMNCGKRKILSIPVLSKIIWIRQIGKDNFEKGENKYKIGVEFSNIKDEDRQRIAKYVEERATFLRK